MTVTTGEPDQAFHRAVFGTAGDDAEEMWAPLPPRPRHSPEGHRQDPLHLDSPLQHFFHEAFVWALLDLFSAN